MPIEETGETSIRTDCLNFDVSLRIHAKKFQKIKLQEEDIEIIFFVGFQIPLQFKVQHSLLTNILLQLVRDIINGICCQGYEKHLEQQKVRPNVNICVAEENLEEEP